MSSTCPKFLYDNGYRKPRAPLNTRLTYHDPCHLAHAQNVRSEPRELLKSVDGVELVELCDADRCCGSAGIYNLTYPEMAGRLLDRKMDDVPDGVETVVTGNPGCMLQLSLGVHKHRRAKKVLHTVEVLDMAYRQEAP